MNTVTDRIDEIQDLLRGSVPEVFSTMLTLEAVPLEAANFPPHGEAIVAASVGFIGEVNGVVYVHLTAAYALKLAGKMLGMEPEEFDGDEMVNDVVGELSNMIVGAVKSRLCDDGLPCALTIPSFIRGRDFSAGATGSPQRRVLGFGCETDEFVVELLLQPQA